MWVDPDDSAGKRCGERRRTQHAAGLSAQVPAHTGNECADLDVAELARRSVPPSTMSLLGLVRHMSEVERHWFRREMAAQDAPTLYCTDEDPDGDWKRRPARCEDRR